MSAAVRKLAAVHLDSHPDESARVLEVHEPAVVAKVLVKAPAAHSADVLARMEPRTALGCFDQLPREAQRRVLAEFPISTAAAFLRPLPVVARGDMLSGLPSEVVAPIMRVLGQPPHSAAALADPGAFTILSDMTVREAVKRFRERGDAGAAAIFVIERSRRVSGAVTPGKLLCAPRSARIGSLQLDPARTVPLRTAVGSLAANPLYSGGPLAVVDNSGALWGVLGEAVLQAASRRTAQQDVTQLAAALGEFYWVGLRDVLGGLAGTLQPRAGTGGAIRGGE